MGFFKKALQRVKNMARPRPARPMGRGIKPIAKPSIPTVQNDSLDSKKIGYG